MGAVGRTHPFPQVGLPRIRRGKASAISPTLACGARYEGQFDASGTGRPAAFAFDLAKLLYTFRVN
jgi:hypothetical protein